MLRFLVRRSLPLCRARWPRLSGTVPFSSDSSSPHPHTGASSSSSSSSSMDISSRLCADIRTVSGDMHMLAVSTVSDSLAPATPAAPTAVATTTGTIDQASGAEVRGEGTGGPDADNPPPLVIVLVESQLAENVGATARAMMNCGLSELRLVAPQCEWNGARSLAVAVHADQVVRQAQVFPDVRSATADMHIVYATTGRPRIEDLSAPRNVLDAPAAVRQLLEHTTRGLRAAVLFGPERNGLRTTDLDLADALIHFPLSPRFCSLNVSQAVLLMCYEYFRAAGAVRSQAQGSARRVSAPEATREDVRMLLERIVARLDRQQQRHEITVRRLQALLHRMRLTRPEVTLLHSVVRMLCRGAAAGSDWHEAEAPAIRSASVAEDELLVVKRAAGQLH